MKDLLLSFVSNRETVMFQLSGSYCRREPLRCLEVQRSYNQAKTVVLNHLQALFWLCVQLYSAYNSLGPPSTDSLQSDS